MSVTVTAIVVHYKNSDLTNRCLRSLVDAYRTSRLAGDVIVVDNSGDFEREAGPGVELTVLSATGNLGFSWANNLGLLTGRGEFFLLINNDAFMTARALQLGVEYLRSHPWVGLWAPALRYANGRPQRSTGNLPTLRELADEYLFFNLFRKLGAALSKTSLGPQPLRAESVIGACWLLPREVVRSVGLLSGDFFFTSEDVEYCHRLAQAGYQIVLDGRTSIVHLGSASQDHASWRLNRHLHEGHERYFEKADSTGQSGLARGIIYLGLALRGGRL